MFPFPFRFGSTHSIGEQQTGQQQRAFCSHVLCFPVRTHYQSPAPSLWLPQAVRQELGIAKLHLHDQWRTQKFYRA